MQSFAKSFYKSQAWKNTRTRYLKSVGGLCERCLSRGLIKPAELVHHKIHLTPDNIDNESITLDWANLEALCRSCHAEEHADIYVGRDYHYAKRIKKRYTVDRVNGKVFSRDDPPADGPP